MQINGDNVICPGRSGLFQCSLMNSLIANWNVNGTRFGFTANDVAGAIINRRGINSLLVERETENIGNRTSVLLYTPSPSNMGSVASIGCDGGRADSCQVRSLIVGMCM